MVVHNILAPRRPVWLFIWLFEGTEPSLFAAMATKQKDQMDNHVRLPNADCNSRGYRTHVFIVVS